MLNPRHDNTDKIVYDGVLNDMWYWIKMWNYLPVNTTNFSSLSNFNKTVPSAYLFTFC